MANLLAFKLLGLEEDFDICDLDSYYYNALKKNENKSEINKAYIELKDDVQRAKILCHLNEFDAVDKSIPIKIFHMQKKTKEEIQKEKDATKEKIIKHAKQKNWKECWYNIQFLNYFKSLE